MVYGLSQRRRRERYDQAWAVSYTLIAAGCTPDKVTPARLLGEMDPEDRKARREMKRAIARMRERKGPDLELLRMAHEVSRGRIGGDLLKQQEGKDAAVE